MPSPIKKKTYFGGAANVAAAKAKTNKKASVFVCSDLQHLSIYKTLKSFCGSGILAFCGPEAIIELLDFGVGANTEPAPTRNRHYTFFEIL